VNVTKRIRDKILSKLNKYRIIQEDDPVSGCFGWSGKWNTENATPTIMLEGRPILISRAAWMVEHGKIPDRYLIKRTCKNFKCSNPRHIYKVLKIDTREDTARKKGYRRGRTRLGLDLPTQLVSEIKKLAVRYDLTITRYLIKRLSEVVAYEKSQAKNEEEG